MQLAGRLVGLDYPPFIVAEMSGNHNGNFKRALNIIDAAADAGVDAVKFQTYTADTMTLKIKEREFFIDNPGNPWHGYSLYELYEKAHTPWEWHKPLFDHCKKLNLIAFSAAFDPSSVDFLEELEIPFYKIASPEIVDIPLIRYVASTGKPMIISTGMATEKEVRSAVETARSNGCKDIILLKCTTEYPATSSNMNLRTIPDMRKRFGLEVGLSDHTLGIGVGIASIAFGAVMIEKHLTLRRSDGGLDATFSMEPTEMKCLVEESKRAWFSTGCVKYGPTSEEKAFKKGRRSLYIIKNILKGENFTLDNIKSIRPGLGLSPKYFDKVIGKFASRDIVSGTPLSWELISYSDSLSNNHSQK